MPDHLALLTIIICAYAILQLQLLLHSLTIRRLIRRQRTHLTRHITRRR